MKKVLFLFAMVCGMQAMAASLVIQKSDGAQQAQDIARIGKWVYEGKDLLLLDKGGNVLAQEPYAEVRRVTFKNEGTPISMETAAADVLRVYPNPAQELLMVQGLDADETLRVYDLQGRLLKAAQGNSIRVADLQEGTYLLQVGTQVVRFIKQ